jgi:hypothetical protein
MRFGLLAALLIGCSGGDDVPPPAASGDGGVLPPPTTNPCDPPTTGCKCTTPGTSAECKVYRRSGDYVSCSTGTMVCSETGAWGPCDGAAVVWDGGH